MALTSRQKGQLDGLLDDTIACAIVEDLDITKKKDWNEALDYLITKLQESKR